MSKYEDNLIRALIDVGFDVETQKPLPNKKGKCDLYLPEKDLYIEVKGFMTFDSMYKLKYNLNTIPNYYIFQASELNWMPEIQGSTQKQRYENQRKIQIDEIINKDNEYLKNISISRLANFFTIGLQRCEIEVDILPKKAQIIIGEQSFFKKEGLLQVLYSTNKEYLSSLINDICDSFDYVHLEREIKRIKKCEYKKYLYKLSDNYYEAIVSIGEGKSKSKDLDLFYNNVCLIYNKYSIRSYTFFEKDEKKKN